VGVGFGLVIVKSIVEVYDGIFIFVFWVDGGFCVIVQLFGLLL